MRKIVLTFLFLPAVSGGCDSLGPTPATLPVAAPASVAEVIESPSYEVGEVLVWSNGRTERVAAIEGDLIRWVDRKGEADLQPANFIVPAFPANEPRSEFRVSGNPDELWPLTAGRQVRFQQERGDKSTRKWACTVGNAVTVQLPGAATPAIPIDCMANFAKSGNPVERITYYYSPELGSLVGRIRYTYKEGETSERWLVARLSPEEAADEVMNAVRKAGLDLRDSPAVNLGLLMPGAS